MGKGNTNESQIQDIESSIIISTQGKKYFVVQLLRGLTEEGFYTRFLIVKKNKKTIARIAFPSSEDVKNLSVNINNNNNDCANSTGKCNRYYCMLSISSLRTCWTATVSKSQ